MFKDQANILRQRFFVGAKFQYYVFQLTIEAQFALAGTSVDDRTGTSTMCTPGIDHDELRLEGRREGAAHARDVRRLRLLALWLAHALTLSRVPLAIALWWSYGSPVASAAIVALAALTDAADGTVARRARRRAGIALDAPSPGDWLDPLVDKLFVAIAIGVFVVHAPGLAPWLALLAARELLQLPLAIAYGVSPALRARLGRLRASRLGKAATVVELIGLGVIAIAPVVAPPVAIISGVLGVAATVERIVRTRA